MKYMVLMLAVLLSACSTTGVGKDKFTCGDGDDKRNCPSVMEAYRDTNGPMPMPGVTRPNRVTDMPGSVPSQGVAIDDSRWPRPVLEPAQVLRIWIAPWIDEKDTLHWPSYLFTEVQARRWTYGQPDFRTAKQLVPLQIEKRQQGEAPKAPLGK